MQHAPESVEQADVACTPSLDLEALALALRDVVVRIRPNASARSGHSAAAGLLAQLARIGPVRASDLAEHVCLDRSTVSRHLRQLEESGDVVRRPDPIDGRAAILDVSPQGRVHAEADFARTVATLGSAVSSWTPAEATTLATLLRRLADTLETS
jgi:DNA-binding MarR family transcriptional regulator